MPLHDPHRLAKETLRRNIEYIQGELTQTRKNYNSHREYMNEHAAKIERQAAEIHELQLTLEALNALT